MTRILHIIPSANPAGGGPIEGVVQRGRYLNQQGHTVEAVTLDAPDSPWLAGRGITLHAIGPGSGSYVYAPQLKHWLAQHHQQYDHFVVNGIWQHHAVAARQALGAAGRPYVLFTHGMLDPWFNNTYPLKRLKKIPYWLLAEYWNLRRAQKVLFTSVEEMERAATSFWPYHCHAQVVNYGTAQPPQNKQALQALFAAQHPQLAHKQVLLYLSRLHEKKGIDLLLTAFAQAAAGKPQLHLVLAGGGDEAYVAGLKQQASQLGIAQHITWTGMLRGDDKWAAMHAAHAFVLPSHQENFGIAVAEALACGVPVLITNKVNIWRDITADGAGFAADDTAAGLAELLQRWTQLTPQQHQNLSSNAQKCYAKRYTVQAMAQSLLDALENPAH